MRALVFEWPHLNCKKMGEGYELEDILHTIPFWVRLSSLDLHFWSQEAIHRIVGWPHNRRSTGFLKLIIGVQHLGPLKNYLPLFW